MSWRRARALFTGRCPRCLEGRVFAGRVKMHDVCPACALRFERESGYFVGAMYVSYALAVPSLFTLFFVLRGIVPGMTEGWAIIGAGLGFLPCVPLVFRTSRVWWLHIDHALDPERPSGR